jgi:hypothetical protein
VLAVPGRTERPVDRPNDVQMSAGTVEFIVALEALGGVLPRHGDTITWDGTVYEVQTGPNADHAWTWSDTYRQYVRTRTRTRGD